MPGPLAVPLITAGATLAGNAGAMWGNARMSKKQRQWAEMMWNKQNAYNTPSEMMSRLKDAGLNPNLAYGSISEGNAGSPQSYQVPKIENPVPDAVNTYLAWKTNTKQLENISADTKLKGAQQLAEVAKTLNLNVQTEQGRQDLRLFMDTYGFKVDQARLETELMIQKQAINEADINIKNLHAREQEIKNMYLEFEKEMALEISQEELRNLKAKGDITREELKHIQDTGMVIPSNIRNRLFTNLFDENTRSGVRGIINKVQSGEATDVLGFKKRKERRQERRQNR